MMSKDSAASLKAAERLGDCSSHSIPVCQGLFCASVARRWHDYSLTTPNRRTCTAPHRGDPRGIRQLASLCAALKSHIADSYRIHQRLIRSRRADAQGGSSWRAAPRQGVRPPSRTFGLKPTTAPGPTAAASA